MARLPRMISGSLTSLMCHDDYANTNYSKLFPRFSLSLTQTIAL